MRHMILIIVLLALNVTAGQDFKAAMRDDICECLEKQNLKKQLSERSYDPCFREILPTYAAQIEATIIGENLNRRIQLGQRAKLDLLMAMESEIIYTCDVYFEFLESEKQRKILIARELADPKRLSYFDQKIAMTPLPRNYLERAQFYFQLNNLEAAETDALHAIEINPIKNDNRLIWTELMLLASIYEEIEQYHKALVVIDSIPVIQYDRQTSKLRALIDRKAGGSLTFSANHQIQNVNKNTNKTQKDTLFKKSNQPLTRSKTKPTQKNFNKKEQDTNTLKKLFKIDN